MAGGHASGQTAHQQNHGNQHVSDLVGEGVGLGLGGAGLADCVGPSLGRTEAEGRPGVSSVAPGPADGSVEAEGAVEAGADAAKPSGRALPVAPPAPVASAGWESVAGSTDGPSTGPGGSSASLAEGAGAGPVVTEVDSRT